MNHVIERAQAIADEVLFPAALATDTSAMVPVTSLDLLARERLYGIAGPEEAGGLALDPITTQAVVEALASGCLATTFVWIQHHNPVRAVARSQTPGLRESWLAPLCRGVRRAGIARAGERPGPPMLSARATADGLVLDGEAPWVTGWGLVDAVLVAARAGDDIVRVLMDAVEADTLAVERLHLVGADASSTVTLRFTGHEVPAERIVETVPLAEVIAHDAATLRTNGSLALGVTTRCCRLLGPGPLDDDLVSARSDLDTATSETMADARAQAAQLALRAAAALTVHGGGKGILKEHHAQRLAREALFLLVFGTRPAIRADLLRRLGA